MRWIVCLLAWLPALLSAAEQPATFAEESATHEKTIARPMAISPRYPPALNAHLDYAQYLTKHTDQDCVARLDLAEVHRGLVEDSPALVLLPQGNARLAELQYAIANQRARCATEDEQKILHLHHAVEAADVAQRARRLNNEYLPMAVMQFNMAMAYRELGDDESAIAALKQAIVMDKLYGLRDDAVENYRFLAKWEGRELSDADVAAFLKQMPEHKVTLRFGWKPALATWTTSTESNRIAGDKVVSTHTRFAMDVGYQRHGTDWWVKSALSDLQMSNLAAPESNDFNAKLSAGMARIMQKMPVVVVGKDGGFKGLQDLPAFVAGATKELNALPATLLPAGGARIPQLQQLIDQTLKTSMTADVLTATAHIGHDYETGMWVGVTLTQGEWRRFDAVVSMPGTPQGFIKHTIEFQLSRWLPCYARASERSCVELMLRAYPKDEAVAAAAKTLEDQGSGKLDYWAETDMRVIVDPTTLRCYAREARVHHFLALGKEGHREFEMGASEMQSTAVYRP